VHKEGSFSDLDRIRGMQLVARQLSHYAGRLEAEAYKLFSEFLRYYELPGITKEKYRVLTSSMTDVTALGHTPGFYNVTVNCLPSDPRALGLMDGDEQVTKSVFPTQDFNFVDLHVLSILILQNYDVIAFLTGKVYTYASMMKIGVLGSGKGSNLQAIIDAVERNGLPVEIALVISDVENAYILERARKHDIPARYINPGKFKTKLEPEIEKEYVDALKSAGVEVVVLAGFMRMLKGDFLNAFPHRVMNIHPSLLPSFKGLEAWRQAVEYGARFAGCTVHFLDAGMDTGPIILQAVVPVLQDDTPELLHHRIQIEEHRLYPEAIKLFAEGRLNIEGRKVIIRDTIS